VRHFSLLQPTKPKKKNEKKKARHIKEQPFFPKESIYAHDLPLNIFMRSTLINNLKRGFAD